MKQPKTVKEAVKTIIKSISEKEIQILKAMPQDHLIQLHHTLGQNIRNNFGLWEKNFELINDCNRILKKSYPKEFKKCLMIYANYSKKLKYPIHPDDASFVIINEVWKNLTKKR